MIPPPSFPAEPVAAREDTPPPARWAAPLAHPWFFPVLSMVLLLPHFFTGPPFSPWFVRAGLPWVTSGDEPHYLVMLHSVLRDGDLDLRNNYDSALRGSTEAGARFARDPLYHHAAYYPGGRFAHWYSLYNSAAPPVEREGWWRFPARPGTPPELADQPEYSTHPPGLPLVWAALLWPWRDSTRLESYTLLLSGLVTCAAAWIFRRFMRRGGLDEGWSNLATAVTFLGTPVWHYGRTDFAEPYLLCLALLAYHLLLAVDRPGFFRASTAGAALAVGLLIKPPFALLAAPLFLLLVLRRQWGRAAVMALPLLAAAGATLVLNDRWFGSPWRPAQAWNSGNLAGGMAGFFFRWDKGLIFYAPALILALACWPRFVRTAGATAWVLLGGIVPYFLLMSLWKEWHGGYCYGPRLILPLLPLAFAALVTAPACLAARAGQATVQRLVELVILASLAMNTAAIIFFRPFWGGFPLFRLFE